jgi:hypothetical protein
VTADISHLVERRGLSVPPQDREPLVEYWEHLRRLRANIDEELLSDNEIAVTWTAVPDGD